MRRVTRGVAIVFVSVVLATMFIVLAEVAGLSLLAKAE